jgi:tetratricopeptide (TPR) repeat protein
MQKYYFFIAVVILSASAIAQTSQNNPANLSSGRSLIKSENLKGVLAEAIVVNNEGVNKGIGGRYEEATGDFRQAVKLAPNCLECRYNLGRALLKTGGESEAIEIFKKVIAEKPGFRDAYAALGDALSETGSFEQGIAAYREALRLDGKDAVTLSNLGHSLEQMKNHNEALEVLSEAIKLDPRLAEARSNRGVTLFSMGRVKEAIENFRTAILLNSASAEAYNNLGVALDQLGKKEAHQYFVEAARLRPDWSYAIYNLGVSNLKRGERDAARTQLASLERLDAGLAENLKKRLWEKYVVEVPKGPPAGNALRP